MENLSNKNIAILGDLHGHFTLALSLLKRWELESNEKIDLILQVGDMGIWPFPYYRIDSASLKHAQRDSDELSFEDYYEGRGDAEIFFNFNSPFSVDASMIFIRGNHEDFDFLNEKAKYSHTLPVPVDYYSKFRYLPDGHVVSVNGLRIGGIGGVLNNKNPKAQYKQKDVSKLAAEGQVDILLTHEPPYGALDNHKGSPDIESLILRLNPTLHFCGHYHMPGQKLEALGNTEGYILNEVNFRKRNTINPGCIGMLKWRSVDDYNFSFLSDDWLADYTRNNYRRKLIDFSL
jgi:predicted phosphodiesterase